MLAYGLIGRGLLLGQVTWALNYWPLLPGLTGGLLLLLTFYLSVIIAQHGLQERLTRRLLLELVIFTFNSARAHRPVCAGIRAHRDDSSAAAPGAIGTSSNTTRK